MYIQPRRIGWIVLVFAGLFLFGMALGKWLDKPQSQPTQVIDLNQRTVADRNLVTQLLDTLTTGQELPFSVEVKEQKLSGLFQGEKFQLAGSIAGHKMEMKRTDRDITVSVDGEQWDPQQLPYALYTPYEHAMLVKAQVQSVTPLPIVDPKKNDMLGYKVSLPPNEVQSMLALWLGPKFEAQPVMNQLAKQVTIDYHLWYDATTKKLRQLVVDLKLDTPAGEKHDQLSFLL